MKALFYPAFDQLVISERPLLVCKEDEVLLKVSACGICGSELETFKKKSERRKPPIIMGHEFCGTIIKKGIAVSDWEPGMRVVSNAIIPCGKCARCIEGKTNLCIHRQVFGMERNGAFAEFVNVPAQCLIHIPESVSSKAACLAEPLANGVHVAMLAKHISIKKVLIIGAGPIGLMTLQAVQALRGPSTIVTDLKDERLEIAKKLGAKYVINAKNEDLGKRISEYNEGEDIDLVIDAVGTKFTQEKALNLVHAGGTVVLIGLHENNCSLWGYDIILPEKQVLGSYGATQEDIRTALQLMADKKVDVTSWVNYYPLEDGEIAFKDIMNSKGGQIKSVLLIDKDI